MYESIKSALEFLDSFGVPGAVASLASKQFVFANDSFSRVVGLQRPEIANMPLSELVNVELPVSADAEVGSSYPIMVQGADGILGIRGYAAVGSNDLVYLVLPLNTDPSTEFELGTAVGKQLEHQRLAAYMHDHVAQGIMGTVFSIESIRRQLEYDHHPTASQLEKVVKRLTEVLQTARESFR